MHKLKTIIVDDNPIYRQSLRMILGHCQEMKGIEIDEASDGLVFLKKLQETTPSFILMDIKMPKMDGIQATKQALQRYPDLKIIALSTNTDIQSIKEMKQAGAKAFLTKDFDKEVFVSVIMKVLNDNPQFILKV